MGTIKISKSGTPATIAAKAIITESAERNTNRYFKTHTRVRYDTVTRRAAARTFTRGPKAPGSTFTR